VVWKLRDIDLTIELRREVDAVVAAAGEQGKTRPNEADALDAMHSIHDSSHECRHR
jgi:hypothetical protein